MNAQNAKDYLPLIQAMANGSVIQFKEECLWIDVEEVVWIASPDRYRIKPKPRDFWIILGEGDYKAVYDAPLNPGSGQQVIHTREVL